MIPPTSVSLLLSAHPHSRGSLVCTAATPALAHIGLSTAPCRMLEHTSAAHAATLTCQPIQGTARPWPTLDSLTYRSSDPIGKDSIMTQCGTFVNMDWYFLSHPLSQPASQPARAGQGKAGQGQAGTGHSSTRSSISHDAVHVLYCTVLCCACAVTVCTCALARAGDRSRFYPHETWGGMACIAYRIEHLISSQIFNLNLISRR